MLLLLGACATTDPGVAGSKPWYEQRVAEIEMAYQQGDLNTEEYLRLKNEADDIRAGYRNRNRPRGSVSVGIGFFSHD
jgi:hypothetical protein